ncbi:MAG: TonB-dependent receptor [Bryobacteraceae bacterium]|nr:TonB-dependent receptor [Bryobacteraceae bacterium]
MNISQSARALSLSLLGVLSAHAQTFRGEIRGSVEDTTGAAISESVIQATHKGTGVKRSTLSSASGEFSIPDLPLGMYTVSTTKSGFQIQQSDVEVVVSRVSSLSFRLPVATQAASVEVTADLSAVETQSTTLTGIVSTKTVEDLPMNGRDFRQMLKLSPGVNPANNSVNGNRTRGNNYMIDGADNNDGFQNASAVNQGGVAGIAGTLLPVEAIDQFSVASGGSAEMGRNGGGIINLVIKSGTNKLHGSAYYFNRNEYFAANTPLAAPGAKVRRIRNGQWGFSAGGPIRKDRTFFFITGETQKANAANATGVTTLSPAWLDQGRAVLSQFNTAENPVSRGIINFYPARVRTGAAVVNNFFSQDANIYDSYNGIIKVDHNFNSSHNLSARYYGGTGKQSAVVDSLAPFLEYFQVAPSRMHNVSVALNSVLSPRIVNNLVLGSNYFLQVFNDYDTSPDPLAAGLNTGVTAPSLRGSPTIRISGFATAGATQPLGRIDTTGHLTDTVSITKGRHQMKIGGEYRYALLDIFYDQGTRGTFTFDGTRGPWTAALGFNPQQRAVADFLAGYPTNASGATIVRPAPGVQVQGSFLQRDYTQKSFDLFFHDTWQVSSRLSLNFGARYTLLGPLGEKNNGITTFIPGQGIVGPGSGIDSLYPTDKTNIAPRFGFAFQPRRNGRTVIRGAYGIFYDTPAVAFFASNNGGGNGGASGINANPGGPIPIQTLSAPSGLVLQSGVDPWAGATVPILGVMSVNQDFRTPYLQNFNLNIQQGLWQNATLQVGYVGSLGRRLVYTHNINAARLGTGSVQSRRPFNAQYPTLGSINQLESAANSSYNSLQVQLTQTFYKGITASFAYTYGKSIDESSEARNVALANSNNLRLDRGPSDFDTRHAITTFVSYSLPGLGGSRWKLLTGGWQINTLITAHTGLPITFRAGTDANGDGDTYDRIDLIGDPFANVAAAPNSTTRRWVNPGAFKAAAPGTTGNLGRNAIVGPGFGSVDPSLFKDFAIRESMKVQFRFEVFNAFNRANYANPTATFNSGSFGLIANTRNGGGAPGLGFGEPRNVQLSLKFLF